MALNKSLNAQRNSQCKDQQEPPDRGKCSAPAAGQENRGLGQSERGHEARQGCCRAPQAG